MKNPCDVCVVKACCRTICRAKCDYGEYLNQKLRNMWPHLYSLNGHPRKHVPATIKKENLVYTKRLEKNHDQMSTIISRNIPNALIV